MDDLAPNLSRSSEYHNKSPNLLKQFQGCIKDRGFYPTVKLTCVEYGKLLESCIKKSLN